MKQIRPWKRNYPIPEDLPGDNNEIKSGLAGWRTERLENPDQVFIDIYGLLDHLTKPGNLQLRGRRGTGKTMYFLKGQYQLAQSFFCGENRDTISAYVDLKSVHQYSEVPSLVLRAEKIYRELIKTLISGIENIQGIHRYILKDYIDKSDIARRWSANNTQKKILQIVDIPADHLLSTEKYNELCEREQNLIQKSQSITGRYEREINPAKTHSLPRAFIDELRAIDNGSFSNTHHTIRHLLINILDTLKIQSLIVYIDEFSSPTVLQAIQIPLSDRILNTFDGNRLSVKLATVPGTSIVLENMTAAKDQNADNMKNNISTFDFETQAIKDPEVIETGNFEVFLRNLANSDHRFLSYLNTLQIEDGFNRFLNDTFETYDDFYEFIKAGEGLPRQMLETFFNANIIKKNHNPDGKINSLHIQIASRQNLQITYQSQIKGSNKCEEILARIYKVNSRVFKIERIPEYNNAIDLLTHWGFIHACPIAPTQEPSISSYPLEYFYTSYKMEVANQMSHARKKVSQEIDDLSTIQKDKLKELYPKAKAVILSDLIEKK